MKIRLAQSAGFCSGVKRAIKIALDTVKHSGKTVCIQGDIVHNEEVSCQIQKAGVKKIKKLSPANAAIMLLRAHGTAQKTIERIKACGYSIVDATCPMVKEIHRIAISMEKAGYRIIVIGDKKHDEVSGIMGQLKKRAFVIDGANRIPFDAIKKISKGCVVVQSTQNLNTVMEIIGKIQPLIPDFKFFNTICRPTRLKQEEIRKIPLENDVMIVIGSTTSANTKRLFEISSSLNPRTYWIQSAVDLKPNWFRKAKSVGVTAGASTPEKTTQEVIARLKKMK